MNRGPLLHIDWAISNRCELGCEHCYSTCRRTDDELCLDDKLKICENIISSSVFSVNLGGGEPLLCDDIHPVILKLSHANVITSICTSGMGMSQEMAAKLLGEGLKTVYISLDGCNAIQHDALRTIGSFDAAMEAISNCIDAELDVRISTTITSDNFNDLESIVSLAADAGASCIELKRLNPVGAAAGKSDLELSPAQESVLNDNVALMKKRARIGVSLMYSPTPISGIDEGCLCARNSMRILASGEVAPSIYNPTVIGDALSQNLLDIWSDSDVLDELMVDSEHEGLEVSPKQI